MKNLAIVKAILAIGAMLLLTACQQSLVLLGHESTVVGTFKLETDASFPSPAHATFKGKEFSGEWTATKVHDAKLAKKYRLIGSRAYESYMVGNAPDQRYQGRADLKADDGTEMICNFTYRAKLGSGNCSVGDDAFMFSLPLSPMS